MEATAARVARTARRALVSFVAGALLLAGAPAGATTVIAMEMADLCAQADRVFVGTVSKVRSEWADSQRRSIETIVTFSNLLPLLGEPGEQITLRFPGGEVDGVREAVSGMPRFDGGDRVVLFARAGAALSPIVGFNQGYFRVIESDAGAVVVGADGLGPELPGAGSAGAAPADGEARPGVPLATFLGVVRDELAQRDGRP